MNPSATPQKPVPYDDVTLERMISFAAGLDEVNRRAYAAIEAYKLERGGVTLIANLFGMSPETIKRGREDLDDPSRLPGDRLRAPGAGRKGVFASQPGLEEEFDRLISTHIAGDPMNENIRWTDLTPALIAAKLQALGYAISESTARLELKKKDFRKRQPLKVIATGTADPVERNTQFENIAELIEQYSAAGLPVMSADTKKKEFLGSLYRHGRLYMHADGQLQRYDHDFPHLAKGKIVPHGIYDLQRNTGFMTLGHSAETPAFITESIALWWNYRGRHDYPDADEVLLLMDGGGANSARSTLFKEELLRLASRLNLPLRVAHYPPYCSKWNPIEHRLFPFVAKSIQGVSLEDAATMRDCINERARTEAGLITRAYLLDKEFEHGKTNRLPVPEGYPLVRSRLLSKWNYTAYPSQEYLALLN